jgi:hypothetical protein
MSSAEVMGFECVTLSKEIPYQQIKVEIPGSYRCMGSLVIEKRLPEMFVNRSKTQAFRPAGKQP